MTQIKIFESAKGKDVEKKVNDWIKNQNITVTSVSVSATSTDITGDTYIVLVCYEED